MLLIFIRSADASILFSAEMSLFPKLVSGEMLKNTNEILSVIWSVCYALGMGVGGIVTHYIGFDMAFVIDSFLYAIAIILLIGLQLVMKKEIQTQSHFEMFKSGFNYIKSEKKVLHLIFLHACVGLTSFDALITLLADFQYKEVIAIPLAIGSMNAIRALGLMLGPFIVSKYISKNNLHYFFIAQGSAIVLWSFLEYNFYLGLLGLFLTGIFITTLWSYTYLLIQEETDRDYMGRVISYNDMFFMLSSVGTALFVGYASSWGVSLEMITTTLGIGFFLVGGYYLWVKKRYF